VPLSTLSSTMMISCSRIGFAPSKETAEFNIILCFSDLLPLIIVFADSLWDSSLTDQRKALSDPITVIRMNDDC
jgi:hypothetical protein